MSDPTPSLEQEARQIIEKIYAVVQVCEHLDPALAQQAMRDASLAANGAIAEVMAFATRQREGAVESSLRKQELLEEVVRHATAQRCLQVVREVMVDGGGYADEDGRIADAIRDEFGLTEEP